MEKLIIKNSFELMSIPTKMGDFYCQKGKEYTVDRFTYLQLKSIYGDHVEIIDTVKEEKEVSFNITKSEPFIENKKNKRNKRKTC